ncbi:MAG TPA: hypothetical protein VGR91_08040 [Stellaceae bacterium]|nr:hypothetical protein [Stellaceae bacterium]
MSAAPISYGLTAQQRWALLVIQELCAAGRPPSLAELAAELGLQRRAAAHGHLVKLRERGHVAWLPGRGRSLTVVNPIPMPDEPRFVGFFEDEAFAGEAAA